MAVGKRYTNGGAGMSYDIGDLVLVVWDDATFGLDAPEPPAEMETVGWVTDYSTRLIEVVSERSDNYQRAYTTIPQACVRHVFKLNVERNSGD